MITETEEITTGADVIDVRNIIARVEYLQGELADSQERNDNDEVLSADGETDLTAEVDELTNLAALLEDLKGNGGDEEYKGDWYPITLIKDDYFEDYAKELAEDIGAIKQDAEWPARHINWEAAADELKNDYQEVEFDGVAYWYR